MTWIYKNGTTSQLTGKPKHRDFPYIIADPEDPAKQDYNPETRVWVWRIDESKAIKTKEINDAYDEAMRALLADYPEQEDKTFSKQESEAKAWRFDNTTSTPFLDAYLLYRPLTENGEPLFKAELVDRILSKAMAFEQATGALTGHRQKLDDDIKNATEETIWGIKWS